MIRNGYRWNRRFHPNGRLTDSHQTENEKDTETDRECTCTIARNGFCLARRRTVHLWESNNVVCRRAKYNLIPVFETVFVVPSEWCWYCNADACILPNRIEQNRSNTIRQRCWSSLITLSDYSGRLGFGTHSPPPLYHEVSPSS